MLGRGRGNTKEREVDDVHREFPLPPTLHERIADSRGRGILAYHSSQQSSKSSIQTPGCRVEQEAPCGSGDSSNKYREKLRKNPTKANRYITLEEALEHNRELNVRNVVIIPPDSGCLDVPTDEEDFPEGEDEVNEVAGEVEVDMSDTTSSEDDNSDKLIPPRWRKVHEIRDPLPNEMCEKLVNCFPLLINKTEYEIWKMFFDDEMLKLIKDQSQTYATRDKGLTEVVISIEDINQFLGIMLISGYHSLPSERQYWSTQPDLHVPIIAETMTQNRFRLIKQCLHLADNQNLEAGNKVAKVIPLYDVLNRNLQQFGIFHSSLSIDESMVPYFGKHSAKMFIRMKPIRFGYKLWVLAGPDGFPYAMSIYTGRSEKQPLNPLGFRVVSQLLDNVKKLSTPSKHSVFFDNFFTSYSLLRQLKEDGFKATGTIRSNRSGGAHRDLASDVSLRKQGRGSYDYRCDGNIYIVKWYDSAVVSLASNWQNHLPERRAKRRVGKEVQQVPQPNLISAYNCGMGGVDLLDRLLSQYRPGLRSKKWWWPLFSNAINTTVVAAWRLFCHLHPNGGVSHLDFRRNIALCLLKKSEGKKSELSGRCVRLPVDIRKDGIDHTNTIGTEGRCVVCGKNTKNLCSKCNVRLHFSHGKQCFTMYHC
jgi:hypothetical protein